MKQEQSPTKLRIGNWNLERPVNQASRKAEPLKKWIEATEADIWVFTETHESINAGKGYNQVKTQGTDRSGSPGECWVTIESKFELETLPVSDPVRTVACRVHHPAAPFLVFGTVLPWQGSTWRGHASANGVAFQASLETQLTDWLKLRETFTGDPLFVVGDFNQDLAPKHYYGSRKNRAALTGALGKSGLRALTALDQDPVWRDSNPHATIDHICMSEDSCWEYERSFRWPDEPQPKKSLSDHFGIGVDLRLAECAQPE